MSESRTDELEIKIAFLERQVEALDEVARATSDEVVDLRRTVQRLLAKLDGDDSNDS